MNIHEADGFQRNVRTVQIIVGALAAGVIFFGVLVLTVLRDAGGPKAPDQPMILGLPLLTAVSLGFGVVALAASFVVPRLMVQSDLKTIAAGSTFDETRPVQSDPRRVAPAGDDLRVLQLFLTQLIVASALTEGGAFFGLMAYMIEGNPVALAVAGALVAVLLSRFPTADRVRAWLDDHLERLAALRRETPATRH